MELAGAARAYVMQLPSGVVVCPHRFRSGTSTFRWSESPNVHPHPEDRDQPDAPVSTVSGCTHQVILNLRAAYECKSEHYPLPGEPHTGLVTVHGSFLARVGQRWDTRWPQRAFRPPTDAQPMSQAAAGRFGKFELAIDVLAICLLLVALFLGWAGVTKLLLALVAFRALSRWWLVPAIVKKNRRL